MDTAAVQARAADLDAAARHHKRAANRHRKAAQEAREKLAALARQCAAAGITLKLGEGTFHGRHTHPRSSNAG